MEAETVEVDSAARTAGTLEGLGGLEVRRSQVVWAEWQRVVGGVRKIELGTRSRQDWTRQGIRNIDGHEVGKRVLAHADMHTVTRRLKNWSGGTMSYKQRGKNEVPDTFFAEIIIYHQSICNSARAAKVTQRANKQEPKKIRSVAEGRGGATT